jgi:N-acetylmuramoyl-L-alanine amidase
MPACPRPIAAALALLAALAATAAAAAEIGGVGMRHAQGATRVALTLSEPVPWRARAAADPARLVIELEAAGRPALPVPPPGGLVAGLRAGLAAPGRTRLELRLARPARLAEAVMTRTAQGARLRVILAPSDGAAPAPAPAPAPPPPAPPAAGADPRPLAMIDPGHGGIDPGAVRGAVQEKEIVMTFARDLAAALEADPGWRVAMTREDDRYLGLRERVARAEAAGADLLLSIHANTVARGDAVWASVFTLSSTASDAETEALAVQENRADVLAGADLSGDPDDVARAVIELSQRATNRASRRMGDALAGALGEATPMLRGRAHAQAGFRVLKSPSTPSALVELGFLSNAEDLARMRDPDWRAGAAAAIIAGLEAWRAAPALRLAAE